MVRVGAIVYADEESELLTCDRECIVRDEG